MSRRTVAVFTSTRADLGPLGPVIAAADAGRDIDLVVMVTGTHLDERYGGTTAGIQVGPSSRVVTFDAGVADDSPSALATALGAVTQGVSQALDETGADVLILLGDRWELLGAAAAAVLHQVPVAHLHSGEVTEGALDERVRHAVTKLADLHLCANQTAAQRIRQLGEEPARIHVTGAPGLDRFRDLAPMSLDELSEELGIAIRRPFGLVTYNPPTVDRVDVRGRTRAVLEATAATVASAVVTYPGADPGGAVVMEEIHAVAVRHPQLAVVPNLGDLYPHAMALADVMIGNSSSGIIEAPSFRLPVVDVGDRQKGRLRARNVINVGETLDAVKAGIESALAPGFRSSLADLVNPYGDGHASERIVAVVSESSLSGLTRKRFVDLEPQDYARFRSPLTGGSS